MRVPPRIVLPLIVGLQICVMLLVLLAPPTLAHGAG